MAENPLRYRRRRYQLRPLRRVDGFRVPSVPEGLDGLPGSVLTAFDPDGFVIVDGVAARAVAGSPGLLPGDLVELCYEGGATRRLLAYRPGEGPRAPGVREAIRTATEGERNNRVR